MRRFALLCLLVGGVNVFFRPSIGAPSPSSSTAKNVQAWALTQDCKVIGVVQVWVSSTCMKVVDPSTSLTLVSSAPDWQVVVFNSRAKSVLRSPWSKFTGFSRLGLALSRQFYSGGVPVSKAPGKATICGQQASVYRTSEAFAKRAKAFSEAKDKNDTGSIVSARVLAAGSWRLPKEEAIILSRFFALPDVPEIPLQYQCTDKGGQTTEVLSTSAVKSVTVPLSQFAAPTGFRPVPSMEAVRVDTTGEAGIENMLQVIDSDLSRKRR